MVEIIDKILEREEHIPIRLYEYEFVKELDSVIATGSPVQAQIFLKKCIREIDQIVDAKEIEKSLEIVKVHGTKYVNLLEADDEKILIFLVENTNAPLKESMEILGSLFFLIEVIEDLEKHQKGIPKRVELVVFLWAYVNIYELSLYHIDRRLREYLNRTKIDIQGIDNRTKQTIKKFKKEKKGPEHASAGELNKILSAILEMNVENSSILGVSSKPKIIRNTLSHSNLFYDSEQGVIKVSGGNRYMSTYTIEEFVNEFSKVFGFLIRWMTLGCSSKGAIPATTDYNTGDIRKIIAEMKKESVTQFKDLLSVFQKIGSMPELKIEYHRYILTLRNNPD